MKTILCLFVWALVQGVVLHFRRWSSQSVTGDHFWTWQLLHAVRTLWKWNLLDAEALWRLWYYCRIKQIQMTDVLREKSYNFRINLFCICQMSYHKKVVVEQHWMFWTFLKSWSDISLLKGLVAYIPLQSAFKLEKPFRPSIQSSVKFAFGNYRKVEEICELVLAKTQITRSAKAWRQQTTFR